MTPGITLDISVALLAQAAGQGSDSSFLAWGLLLAVAALGLFLLELVLPSGGILGLLTVGAVIASIVCFFRYDRVAGFAAIGGYCILVPIAVVFAYRLWTASSLGRRMILGDDDPSFGLSEDEAFRSSEEARQMRLRALSGLIGARGRAETALRPVGFVTIEGQRIDAIAESGFIDAGSPVTVVDIVDNQVRVRPVE